MSPIFKSEEEALSQHKNYGYDTDLEGKYRPGAPTYFLYLAVEDVFPNDSIILDIGCNSGVIGIALMRKKNIVCYGIDIASSLVYRAVMKGILAKIGKAECLPWRDNYFDGTILLELLEHVYDPEKVLNEAIRVTKEGGVVTGSVPHPKGQAGAKGFVNHAYHTRVFERKSLRKLLKSKLAKVEMKNIYTDPDITGLPNWIWWRGTRC